MDHQKSLRYQIMVGSSLNHSEKNSNDEIAESILNGNASKEYPVISRREI